MFVLLIFFKSENESKLPLISMILILCLYLIFQNGRMALISYLFVIAYFIFLRIKTNNIRMVVFISILSVSSLLYIANPLLSSRVDRLIHESSQLFSNEQPSSVRLSFYKVSIDMIKSEPIFGHGPGSFRTIKNNTPHLSDDSDWYVHYHTHNEYLTLWSQYGLIGFSLFSLMVLLHFSKARHLKEDEYKQVATLGMIVFLLNCFTDSLVFTDGFTFVFLLFVTKYFQPSASDLTRSWFSTMKFYSIWFNSYIGVVVAYFMHQSKGSLGKIYVLRYCLSNHFNCH